MTRLQELQYLYCYSLNHDQIYTNNITITITHVHFVTHVYVDCSFTHHHSPLFCPPLCYIVHCLYPLAWWAVCFLSLSYPALITLLLSWAVTTASLCLDVSIAANDTLLVSPCISLTFSCACPLALVAVGWKSHHYLWLSTVTMSVPSVCDGCETHFGRLIENESDIKIVIRIKHLLVLMVFL